MSVVINYFGPNIAEGMKINILNWSRTSNFGAAYDTKFLILLNC